MTLNPKYRRMGLTEADAQYVAHFTRVARLSWGWPTSRIEAAIAWGAANQHLPIDKLETGFIQWSGQQGWQPSDMDNALGWHSTVEAHGVPEGVMQPQSMTDADTKRLAEIEGLLKTDRRAYNAAADEYFDLLAKRSGEPAETASLSASEARKREIEALMQSDRAAYHATGADREYLAILQSETGAPPPSGNSPGQPAGDAFHE